MKKWLLGFCLLTWAAAGWAEEPVRIAFIGPLTGEYALVGKEARQVLMLLAADVNAQGGVLGRQVEMLFEDDGGDPRTAALAGKKVVRQGAVAAIGSLRSGVTESLQGVFNDGKIVHVSFGSTAPSLTEKGYRYFFRTCPQDKEQAKAAVNLIRKAGIKKVALLHDNSLYGKELAERVGKLLFDWMIDVVYDGDLVPGRVDYLPVLEKIRSKGPELIFYAGYYPEAARLLQGRERMKWDVALMGGDGVNNPELVKLAGRKAAAGFYFLSPPNPSDLKSPRAKQFLDRYAGAYGERPASIHALFAGDAFLALVESVAKTQTIDPEKMADYLHRTYFNPMGLTGTLYFDYRGDIVSDLHGVYQIDGEGRFVLQTLLQHGRIVQ